jgi:hypothetical protein
MQTLAALIPPVVVAAAFIAIAIGVKRHSDREAAQERSENPPE